MKVSLHFRAALTWLLLLGVSLQSIGPVAFAPDHYLEHGSPGLTLAEERVELHAEDGDHHHDAARLELGESTAHHCHLCAHFGNSHVFLIKKLGVTATVDIKPAPAPEAVFLKANLTRNSCQPRAPPRA